MKPMEETIMAGNPNPNPNPSPNANPNPPPTPPSAAEAQRAPGPGLPAAATERKATPQKQKAINCPRCNSTNTKFCYYNNYSLQQPRYFCKTYRRYWTDGGSLRNLPVGGGSRKNKRSSSSSVASSAASTSAVVAGTVPMGGMHQGANDLNLQAFPHHHGRVLHPSEKIPGGAMASNSTGGGRGMGAVWAMELLRSTGCYVPLPQVQLRMPPEYHQQVQNMLGFSLNTGGGGDAGGYGAGLQGAQESATGRLLFPLEDLKPGVNAAGGVASGGDQFEHSKDQGGGSGHETRGFWDAREWQQQ